MRGPSFTRLMLVTTALMLAFAGWRWHLATATAPDRLVVDGVSATAVLLVQPWDCPERTAAMAQWVDALASDGADPPLPLRLAVLGDEPGALDPALSHLPRLAPDDVAMAARAVLRSGIPGTPALVLVDADGRVLFTDTFAPSGPGPRLALAARLLPGLHAAASDPLSPFEGM